MHSIRHRRCSRWSAWARLPVRSESPGSLCRRMRQAPGRHGARLGKLVASACSPCDGPPGQRGREAAAPQRQPSRKAAGGARARCSYGAMQACTEHCKLQAAGHLALSHAVMPRRPASRQSTGTGGSTPGKPGSLVTLRRWPGAWWSWWDKPKGVVPGRLCRAKEHAVCAAGCRRRLAWCCALP